MHKQLSELVEKLKAAAGANLKSVVLHGSAAGGEFHAEHSDFNVMLLLERIDLAELEKLNRTARWWESKSHPAPLVFTPEELTRSADVFAIELLDIKARHEVLAGEDFFTALEVPMNLHRAQVERELRTNLVRLRQHYLASPGDQKAMLKLMTESVSSFGTLFRHALIALGEPRPEHKRDAVDRLAALLGFDASAFHTILEVRAGRRPAKVIDVQATFRGYLEAVARVTHEIDVTFEKKSRVES
jgi:hypothetical protein